jgi:hypothetical protein
VFGMMARPLPALAAAVLLAGCAGTLPQAAPDSTPLLRLPPAALGRSLALQQRLDVFVHGRAPQQVEVLLEADAQAVRLALVSLGQTAATLQWDGQQLQETRAPWWPAAVRGERILSDLQLVLWPAEAVRAALPTGWTLEASTEQRVLRLNGDAVATVRYAGAQHAELVNLRDGYRLAIESRSLGGAP